MNHRTPTYQSRESGFSALELLITIVVTGMFVIAIYQLFGVINTSMSNARQKAIASELAYSHLRRYAGANTNPGTWFSCSTAGGGANTNDYTVNPNAPGQVLSSGTLDSVDGLAPPVTYEVRALALYGCSGGNAASPLRIEASVTYGPHADTVKHATLKGY